MCTPPDENMLRKLRTVGISTFLKYYFVFKYYPQAKCVAAFDEEDAAISPESRLTKTNAAQAIFRQGWHVAALQYIRDHARKVDARRNQEAAWLLQLESDACPAAAHAPRPSSLHPEERRPFGLNIITPNK